MSITALLAASNMSDLVDELERLSLFLKAMNPDMFGSYTPRAYFYSDQST